MTSGLFIIFKIQKTGMSYTLTTRLSLVKQLVVQIKILLKEIQKMKNVLYLRKVIHLRKCKITECVQFHHSLETFYRSLRKISNLDTAIVIIPCPIYISRMIHKFICKLTHIVNVIC